MRAHINSDRLAALLGAINRFGADPATGGYDRRAFSAADMDVRRWLLDTMRRDGLEAWMDPVGNVVGRFGPPGPAVVVGSHLDTVPAGGAFDGALGVAAGLECVRAVREAGLALQRPIEVLATADEEGRFGGMLGSQAIAGLLPPGWIADARDAEGVPLAEAMRAAGLDPAQADAARRDPAGLHAFLELHIEQGPVLEAQGRDIGVATGISGCALLAVTLTGAANHSGTTPMDMRRDALVGLSHVGAALPQIARTVGTDDARLTIGFVELTPNQPHTIPGEATFTIVLRDVERGAMEAMAAAIDTRLREVCAQTGLAYALATRSWLDPVALDAGVRGRLMDAARSLGADPVTMPSGAGHDAQMMASVCPAGLLFVPSRGGISHAPEEFTPWSAIERGAEVLLCAVADLASGD
ncbi:Zn-dependent hydrolase [Acuticoccus sp. I52.16.1]|uniref:Zn-dependent hydrolase n=1 Tax=Acuticoccus sp. I52.16.1 TaxID=2928472 RepID=UPI001FD21CFA|nr:Zn-dependent hydrolase [Acuticoccus sp. I52.16.1]UOM34012.1 Zn-dependent hydrolase [Acuticoccus sp. I52.16.1]